MGTGRARRGVDRISDLPDELLESILLRLPCTADAVRTSVLSRRWRRVWAHVPALSFRQGDQAPGASILNGVDASLAAHAAPTLDRLSVSTIVEDRTSQLWHEGLAARVAQWLRFASRRQVAELSLSLLRHRSPRVCIPIVELELPVCQRATTIDVSLVHVAMKLRLPEAGTFAALRVLRIDCVYLEMSDLERAVSSQCPRLQEIALTELVRARKVDLSIRSELLQRLKLGCRISIGGQITVQAPRLLRLEMPRYMGPKGCHIAAPSLAEMTWHNSLHP
ncbi:hypothetical protein ACP70R_005659 [Stipagrostis hirtigluma subsp. patula]